MRKILTVLLITLFTFSTSSAYSQLELSTKKNTYKNIIKTKVGTKLENISEVKLQKILVLVDGLVTKYNKKTTLSDAKKLQKIAILLAFKEIVNEKIEDEFSDIDLIFGAIDEDRGFKTIDKNVLSLIKENSYIKGNKNAEILWLEYSDMECPFCARLHNQGTFNSLQEKYSDKISYSLQHFPLAFHRNALPAAHYLECTGKLQGSEIFYQLEDKIFSEENSSGEFIVETAVSLGVNKSKLNTCVNDEVFASKITAQQDRGTNLFGVTGTPGNVLINTKTGEYDVISGAYPTASFVEIIDRLLK